MNKLAITLGDLYRLNEAESIMREVLEKRRQILGDEHPNTNLAMNNLAHTKMCGLLRCSKAIVGEPSCTYTV